MCSCGEQFCPYPVDGAQFGKDLKELRLQKGYGSVKLSKDIGKAVTYVSQMEKGKIKHPPVETCRQLLNVLLAKEDRANAD